MLVAFLSYKDQFSTRIGGLITSGFRLRTLNVQTQRLSDIVLSTPEPAPRAASSHPIQTERPSARLSAHNLSVRYSPRDPWIFRGISFEVPAGQSLAITGPSGCGKSTLMKVLIGLTPPQEGGVEIDGVNIVAQTLESYRGRISTVLQEDGLFSGSVAENISGFAQSPNYTWIEECCRRSAIWEDIRRMPMGLETLIGDLGSNLSGGQRQRVLLARALYRRPEILFLDEATSHLDEKTEADIALALHDTTVTQIIIAHRPATIVRANFIARLTTNELQFRDKDGSRIQVVG
jgi:ATP-binding cassette subfamily B protein RaxB